MFANTTMQVVLHIGVHVVLVAAALATILLIWGIAWELAPNSTERIMRGLATIGGVLCYVAAKTLGISIPNMLLAAVALRTAYTLGVFGFLIPSAVGLLVSWWVCRFLSSASLRRNLVGMRLLGFVVSLTLLTYLDLYAATFDTVHGAGFELLMPNVVMLLAIIAYAVVRFVPHPEANAATAALLVLALSGMLLAATPAMAQSPQIYAPDGTYLGNLNTNQFDPNSVSNPFGRYGNPYSPDSINNQFGKYGSPFSRDSVRNPFATGDGNHR